METAQPKEQQSMSWWISSLAISVVCCAVLFVIFANYLLEIKTNLALENYRLEQMSMHEDQMLSEIQSLRHSLQGGAVVTTSAPATPADVSPAVPNTTPAQVTPPPASPAAVPEVPAK